MAFNESKYTRGVVLKAGKLVVINQTMTNQLNLKGKNVIKNAIKYLTAEKIDTKGNLVILTKAVVRAKSQPEGKRFPSVWSEECVLQVWDLDEEDNIRSFLCSDSHGQPLCRHTLAEMESEKPTAGAKKSGICDRMECRGQGTDELLTAFLNADLSPEKSNNRWKNFFTKFPTLHTILLRDHESTEEELANCKQYLSEEKVEKFVWKGNSHGVKLSTVTLREYRSSRMELIKNNLRPVVLHGARKEIRREFTNRTFGHGDKDTLRDWRTAINDVLYFNNFNANLVEIAKSEFKGAKCELNTVSLKQEDVNAEPGADFESINGGFLVDLGLDQAYHCLVPRTNSLKAQKKFEPSVFASFSDAEFPAMQEFINPPLTIRSDACQYGPIEQTTLVRAVVKDKTSEGEAVSTAGLFGKLYNMFNGWGSAEKKEYSRLFNLTKTHCFDEETQSLFVHYYSDDNLKTFREDSQTTLPKGDKATLDSLIMRLTSVDSKGADLIAYETELLRNSQVKIKSTTELLESKLFVGTKDEARIQMLSAIDAVAESVLYRNWFSIPLRQLGLRLIEMTAAALHNVDKLSIIICGFKTFEKLMRVQVHGSAKHQLASNEIHNYAVFRFLQVVDQLVAFDAGSLFGLQVMKRGLYTIDTLLCPVDENNSHFVTGVALSLPEHFASLVSKSEEEILSNPAATPEQISALESLKSTLLVRTKTAKEIMSTMRTKEAIADISSVRDSVVVEGGQVIPRGNSLRVSAAIIKQVEETSFKIYDFQQGKNIEASFSFLEDAFVGEQVAIPFETLETLTASSSFGHIFTLDTLAYNVDEAVMTEYRETSLSPNTWFQTSGQDGGSNNTKQSTLKGFGTAAEEVEDLIVGKFHNMKMYGTDVFVAKELEELWSSKMHKSIKALHEILTPILAQLNLMLFQLQESFNTLPGGRTRVDFVVRCHAEALYGKNMVTALHFTHNLGSTWSKHMVSRLQKGFSDADKNNTFLFAQGESTKALDSMISSASQGNAIVDGSAFQAVLDLTPVEEDNVETVIMHATGSGILDSKKLKQTLKVQHPGCVAMD